MVRTFKTFLFLRRFFRLTLLKLKCVFLSLLKGHCFFSLCGFSFLWGVFFLWKIIFLFLDFLSPFLCLYFSLVILRFLMHLIQFCFSFKPDTNLLVSFFTFFHLSLGWCHSLNKKHQLLNGTVFFFPVPRYVSLFCPLQTLFRVICS